MKKRLRFFVIRALRLVSLSENFQLWKDDIAFLEIKRNQASALKKDWSFDDFWNFCSKAVKSALTARLMRAALIARRGRYRAARCYVS